MTLHGFDAVARTALLTTAFRADETARPDRLYDDPYAAVLAGHVGLSLFQQVAELTEPNRERLAADGRKLPDTLDYNAIRTRFFDDWLLGTVAEGYGQVVIAAAGMDTRAYRLPWPHPVEIYEIDRSAVLERKEVALAAHARAAGVRSHSVGADLLTDDWRAELISAGFRPEQPAVWLIEGVLYYLPGDRAECFLSELGEFCPAGTPLACDLINEVALTAPSTRKLLALFAGWGSPWVFGNDEPELLLSKYGFDVAAVQPGEPEADYGRWRDSVLDRAIPDVPRVFYVHGKRV